MPVQPVNTMDPADIVCPDPGTYVLRYEGIGRDAQGNEECVWEDFQSNGKFEWRCRHYFVIDDPSSEWNGYGTGVGPDGKKEPRLFRSMSSKFGSDRSNLYKLLMALSHGEFPGPMVERKNGWKDPANMPEPARQADGSFGFDVTAICHQFLGKKFRAFINRSERGWPDISPDTFAPLTEGGSNGARRRGAPTITAITGPDDQVVAIIDTGSGEWEVADADPGESF